MPEEPLLWALRKISDGSFGWKHDSTAFAKANARMPISLTISAQDDFITIFEKSALLPGRQQQRVRAAARHFQQTSD